MKVYKNFALFVGLLNSTFLFSGCQPTGTEVASKQPDATSKAATNQHSGWWCTEHGIPEEECSMCSAKFAAECKAKGDWCNKHNRAESQCFICDPTRAEKYSKLYEAKYGKAPPAITE